MARKKLTAADLTEQSVARAEFAANALGAAEQLGVKKKVVTGFDLDDSEFAISADLPGLSATLKKKLTKKDGKFTVADTASIVMAVAESLVEGERYGDPELLDDGFDDFECVDSTRTNLSQFLPKTGKRFAFNYEYDFGDGWRSLDKRRVEKNGG